MKWTRIAIEENFSKSRMVFIKADLPSIIKEEN